MLEQLLKRANLLTRLRGAWRHDAEEALKPVRKEVRRLTREVEELRTLLQDTSVRAERGDRNAAQLRMIAELNTHQQRELAALPAVLDTQHLAANVRSAITTATMRADPFHHIVVEQLLPHVCTICCFRRFRRARSFRSTTPAEYDAGVLELARRTRRDDPGRRSS